jgi:secondary thiamine-phosphate synthase enzyme
MQQVQQSLALETRGKGLYEFTEPLREVLAQSGIGRGLATLFVMHTSASLLIQEHADPEVLRDLERFFSRLVPEGDPLFKHVEEGPDDMPAHVRAALTQTSLGIPVDGGRLLLGTWQGVYLYEHRNRPHTRTVIVHISGE